MIKYNGENCKVVPMACGYMYRLRPVTSTMNDSQIRKAVRMHYLEK